MRFLLFQSRVFTFETGDLENIPFPDAHFDVAVCALALCHLPDLTKAVDETARFRRIFAERRRAMVDGLRAIGLGVGFEPEGAFYVLANARRFTTDSVRFAYEILERAHVAVTPGAAFGSNAEGYLRFSYASSVERIQEGLRRLGAYLAGR